MIKYETDCIPPVNTTMCNTHCNTHCNRARAHAASLVTMAYLQGTPPCADTRPHPHSFLPIHDIPHSYVRHDSLTCVRHDSCICVQDDSRAHAWHDSSICATSLAYYMCDMTPLLIWATWLLRSHVQHDSFIRATWLMYHRREDRTPNNYDCQDFQYVFTGVPVHIKHMFTGVPNISDKFHDSKQSPRHPQDLWGKLTDLEIQIFSVWCPFWVLWGGFD